MAKPGLRKIGRYSESFRLSAVKLSFQPDVTVKSVAEALDIHPFMLSRWRKQHREAVMRKKVPVDEDTARQLRELNEKESHRTPFGTAQQFTYCYCRKSSS